MTRGATDGGYYVEHELQCRVSVETVAAVRESDGRVVDFEYELRKITECCKKLRAAPLDSAPSPK